MSYKNRDNQLKRTIVEYNLYCKDNVKNFIFNNVNFQELISQIEANIKDGNNRKARELTENFFTDEFIWGFICADLSQLDLSNVQPEHLIRIPFSSLTKWPSSDKLPQGFNPDNIIKNAKNFKDAKLEKVHKANVTGKGVKVAYLDSPFDIEHEAFNNTNVEYIPVGEQQLHFHGYAVVDRLLNIAPSSNIIYYGCGDDEEEKGVGSKAISKIKALKQIINRIESGENIVAVGMSTTLEEVVESIKDNILREKAKNNLVKIKNKLIELGVEYIDSPLVGKNFNYACKRDPLINSQDIDNYIPYCDINYRNQTHILEADKLRPMPCTTEDYVYENALGCASWTIPQVVGFYTLAKQIDNEISYKEFAEICKTTGNKNKNGINILNVQEMIKEVEFRLQNRQENIF